MKLKSTLITAALLLSVSSVQAALVETDWKTEGDALATLDTETGIEWLDLTQTDDMSVNQAESQFDSTFSGWRLPTRNEVLQMMMNVFPSHAAQIQAGGVSSIQNDTVKSEAENFRSLFGRTHTTSIYDYTLGMFKDDDGPNWRISGVVDHKNNSVIFYSDVATSDDENYSDYMFGVYLVSDGGTTLSSQQDPSINANNANAPAVANVSAPAMVGGLLALIGMGWVRRRALEVTR